ncbi:MAG: hypothetical protein QM734_09670 [Cyclobacteriaceae bacterium]
MTASDKKTEPLKTILVISMGMLVVYYVTKWPVALGISLIIGVLGLLSEYVARKIDWIWMKLTWVLSLIVPNIILTVFFFLFLTPIALVSRIFAKKDQLILKNRTATLFKDYNKQFDERSFERPW